jgi:hypothetical protein
MMTKLKPLPCLICGKEPRIRAPTICGEWHRVWCESVDKYSWHDMAGMGSTESAAIKRWNRMVSK